MSDPDLTPEALAEIDAWFAQLLLEDAKTQHKQHCYDHRGYVMAQTKRLLDTAPNPAELKAWLDKRLSSLSFEG